MIALPDNNRKPPAGTGGIPESDQLAAGLLDCIEIAEAVAETEAGFAGVLMNMSAESIRELIGDSPCTMAAPEHRFIWDAVKLCVDEWIDPIPLAVVDIARRSGLEVPRGFRGCVLSSLYGLSGGNAPPVACAGWLFDQVRANWARRATENALATAGAAVWAGDLTDLRTVVTAQLRSIVSALDEAGAAG